MQDTLYLEVTRPRQDHEEGVFSAGAPLETFVALFLCKVCKFPPERIVYVATQGKSDVTLRIAAEECVRIEEGTWAMRACSLPVLAHNDRDLVAGGAAVARKLAEAPTVDDPHVHPDGLLGFRRSCLQAPNETSVWTKYCEVEIVKTTRDVIDAYKSQTDALNVPDDVVRFERHLNQPLHMHNVYKLARETANLTLAEKSAPGERKCKPKSKIIIESSTPKENLGLLHAYSEGPYITLADLLLYPCFYLIFKCSNVSAFKDELPSVLRWFQRLEDSHGIADACTFLADVFESTFDSKLPLLNCRLIPRVEDVSLYKCDPKRSNRKKKTFTREEDVAAALECVEVDSELNWESDSSNQIEVDWNSVPPDADPFGGHLPEERMLRKRQQLESLARVVLDVVEDGHKIVDFCSGGGHLGILLAHLLPRCDVVLLENKEESMKRARRRVLALKLPNVYFVQCNLDFFRASFDVGVALHACGVATDLVLENCINVEASFVVCPCCYGFLHVTDRLRYPRSEEFHRRVPLDRYMCIGHAADQTHVDHEMEARGYRCMRIIDSDRARHAMSFGYSVKLSRLAPLTCTPKNDLIVGVKKNVNFV